MPKPNKPVRSVNFTRDEIDALLDCIEEVLPIGMDEWQRAENQHVLLYPDKNRTKESLRRKFQMLYLIKQPTGSPECPPHVRSAKLLQYAIRDKAEVSSAGSDMSENIAEEETDELQEATPEQEEDNDHNNSDLSTNSAVDRAIGASVTASATAASATVASATAASATAASAAAASGTAASGTVRSQRSRIPRNFSIPVSRVGSKRKQRPEDDDDEISMKDLLKFAMIQQQESRIQQQESRNTQQTMLQSQQTMIQMLSMTTMTIMTMLNAGKSPVTDVPTGTTPGQTTATPQSPIATTTMQEAQAIAATRHNDDVNNSNVTE